MDGRGQPRGQLKIKRGIAQRIGRQVVPAVPHRTPSYVELEPII
ncbi:hypothetical protein BRPE64_ACDS02210 [Caballeronia insecticola]|uniref:Uncharacterized protein n=1 Tax=Caballeronia insecticola TaxID=758793 RepID=R4WM91_9BURK|nr:hypothetical protein BRPE64_ACDS02210 [Caballeronia insecticola]